MDRAVSGEGADASKSSWVKWTELLTAAALATLLKGLHEEQGTIGGGSASDQSHPSVAAVGLNR